MYSLVTWRLSAVLNSENKEEDLRTLPRASIYSVKNDGIELNFSIMNVINYHVPTGLLGVQSYQEVHEYFIISFHPQIPIQAYVIILQL